MSTGIAILLTVTYFTLLANGLTVKLETRNLPTTNKIHLQCLDGDTLISTTNIGLNRTIEVNGEAIEYIFTNFSAKAAGKVSFDITPDTEGNYTCINLDTNTKSDNSLPLVGKWIMFS